jgi:two-component system cell cycle sensor histidine kinase/response regulator CckA
MMEFLKDLFTSDFMGHGYCYLWKPEIVWLHVVSDVLITLAYYSIPVTLVYFVCKRRDLPFNWMFLMFGAFILGCGTTHVMEVWTIWHGTYRLTGIIKLITAGLSVGTAIALVPLIPQALALPSPARLEAANRELEQEACNRQRAEEEIKKINEGLERRVFERTTQLEAANRDLQNEITERKRAEEALRKSEARKRAILESAMDCIISINQEGTIIEFNAAAEKVFGYSRAEVLGRQLAETIIPPSLRERHRRGLAHFLATGEGPILGKRIEMPAMRANGTEFPVELAVTRIDQEGARMFTAYLRDLSDRKRADARFRLVVEAAPNAMVMVNQKGKIVLVNAQTEKLFGYHREELIGQAVDILVPAKFRHAHPQHREDFFASPQARPMGVGRDLYGLRKDGSEFPVEIGLNPIETDEGTWVLSAIVDITERKRAEKERKRLEAQMQHAQKLESLGVLAGGIAHDFNNLLVSILGNAGLALMDLAPESPARPTVQAIETAALRTAELTKQLLAYSGKGKFLIQPLDLSRLVEEMAHLLKLSISKKAVLRTRLARNLPAIDGDAIQIQQVVMNLITNASEALGDTVGDIVVSTGVIDVDRVYLSEAYLADQVPEGRYVYVDVTDTGCGMDKETQTRIFDPFFTTKFTGRGLGLAAVQGIVRGHQGAIRVYSEPGHGTAFKVLFPSSEQAVSSFPQSFETVGGLRGTGTILIIDDEPDVRVVTRRTLEKAGFIVMTAEDGQAGVQMFQSHADEIKTVLLDLTMPNMSGEEVFRAIRTIRPETRVVLMSGYNEQDTISLFPGKGLAGFIQKPYQPLQLIKKVFDVLGQSNRATSPGIDG